MVRTKRVSKGSRASTRASTRKASTILKLSTSASSSVTSVPDNDGFAMPAPVLPTLEVLQKDLAHQFEALMADYDATCKTQIANIKTLFFRKKAVAGKILKKPITELFADYQPPPSSAKNLSSAQKSVLINSSVMQDRTNTQYSSKNAKPKGTIQIDNIFKQPVVKTRNSLRLQQQQKPAPVNRFVTPVSTRPVLDMPAVTPKVSSNTPLSVLRRPRAGEFAISMTGSPLMVSAIPQDEIPSVSVPLPDGTVLSILPRTGITADQLPSLNEELRAQLETLQSNLKIITGNR